MINKKSIVDESFFLLPTQLTKILQAPKSIMNALPDPVFIDLTCRRSSKVAHSEMLKGKAVPKKVTETTMIIK